MQLRILLVAEPVGAGDVEQLEGFDFSGRRQVGAAAEILELAGLVNRNLLIRLSELLDEVALHEVALGLELFETFFPRQKLAGIGQVLLDEFLHLLFDLLEIFGSERGRAIEIVEESVLRRGTVAKLGLGKKLEHGRGQQVRRGMPIDFKRLGIPLRDDAQIGVLVERPGEINQIAIRAFLRRRDRSRLGGKGGVGKTRADGLGNVERSGALRDFSNAAVGKLEMNAVRHG